MSTSCGTARPAKGPPSGKGFSRRGAPHDIAPAERAAAGAQPHRQQRVLLELAGARLRQARPGEADEQPALLDPGHELGALGLAEGADVGEDQHVGRGVQHLRQRRLDHLGEGLERLAQVVQRIDQILRLAFRPPGHQPDLAPPHACRRRAPRPPPSGRRRAARGRRGCAAPSACRAPGRPCRRRRRTRPVAEPSTRSMPFGSGPIAVDADRPRGLGVGAQRARRAARRRRAAAASAPARSAAVRPASPARGRAAPRPAPPRRRRRCRRSATASRRRSSRPANQSAQAARSGAHGRRAEAGEALGPVRRRPPGQRPRSGGGAEVIVTTAAGRPVARRLAERRGRAVHAPRPVRRIAPAAVEQHQQRHRRSLRAAGSAPARRRRGSPRPAPAIRSSSSHQGVCSGIFSGSVSPSSSRTPGKTRRPGAGGTARSSHQSTGRVDEPDQEPRREEGD